MSNWIKKELCVLNEENMNLLLNFKIPGILVKNFIPQEVCEVISGRLKSRSFSNYDHLANIPVHQLGLCHNQYAHDEKNIYFSKKREAEEEINDIYRGVDIDPVKMVIELLRENTNRNVDIYEEDNYGKYFAGAFRSFKGHGKLHADHAPSHIKQSWEVTKLLRQLTWNVYYSNYDNHGGEVVIYDTIHTSENDCMKVRGEYYFPYEVLESENCLKVRPSIGDLIIFNTQNFHEILGHDDGYRISQTSFLGLTPDGDIKLWS